MSSATFLAGKVLFSAIVASSLKATKVVEDDKVILSQTGICSTVNAETHQELVSWNFLVEHKSVLQGVKQKHRAFFSEQTATGTHTTLDFSITST